MGNRQGPEAEARNSGAARGAGLGNMAEGVGAHIAKLIGIVGGADAHRIDDKYEGAAHDGPPARRLWTILEVCGA